MLTHTAGLGYGLAEPEDGIHRALGVSDGLDLKPLTAAENLVRIAEAPLLFEPGSAWRYSCASDVLGHLLEVVSGQDLGALFVQEIAAPLGLVDTAFGAVGEERLVRAYRDGPEGAEQMHDGTGIPYYGGAIRYSPSRALKTGLWSSGGVGLCGTANDYVRLLNAILADDGRLLHPDLARRLLRDEISGIAGPGPGMGWSLGAAVVREAGIANVAGPDDAWGWGGVYGSHYFADPVRKLAWVCLTNTALAGMEGGFPSDLRRAIYADLAAG